MELDGLGVLSGIAAAVGSMIGPTETALPPAATAPQPVLELRVAGEVHTLPPEHVLAVLAGVHETTGWPQLELTLGTDAALMFEEITSAHVGQVMDLAICDRILMSPVIQEPISGGQIVISGAFTTEETEALADQITGAAPCDPAGIAK